MKDNSAKYWFLRKFTRDLFCISTSTWLLLFIMEIIKPGIASNYVSLPHLAVLVFFFAVVALYFQPPRVSPGRFNLSAIEISILTILSIASAVFLAFTLQATPILTALIIIVTVLALWGGTLVLNEGP